MMQRWTLREDDDLEVFGPRWSSLTVYILRDGMELDFELTAGKRSELYRWVGLGYCIQYCKECTKFAE
jgi:hypothetical protein